MKTKLFILYLLFFGLIGYSQVDTKIITVDLSKPHKKSITIYKDSVSTELDCSKWLSVKARDMVAVKLININSLKYIYKIDTKNISFHDKEAQVNKGVKNAIADSVKLEKFIIESFDKITIEKIIEANISLNNDISQLNIDVEAFYKILKGKKILVEKDYLDKRVVLLDKAKTLYSSNDLLISALKKTKKGPKKEIVEKDLEETKEKAEKTIKSIIEKFYTIDLEIYTLPIDVQGKNIDALEFKLRRFDKETKEEDLSFASTPYNIWVRGGFKIDVSAGLFFSSLYDLEYDKRDDPATPGNKIITLKNGGDYDLAFGSTINVYVRMRSWIVPTINLGAVITKNEKLQVLFGLGCMLGKQERIILTAGLSMGRVDRIADSYQVGGSYNLGDSGNIPTQNQFKFGHFFGITYNLSKVKKISLDKGIEEN